jgi:hypothetical protein
MEQLLLPVADKCPATLTMGGVGVQIAGDPLPRPVQPVSVKTAGLDAAVLYAGANIKIGRLTRRPGEGASTLPLCCQTNLVP